MNGSLTNAIAFEYDEGLPPDTSLFPKKAFTGESLWEIEKKFKETRKIGEEKEKEEEEVIREEILVMAKPIPYIIFFSIFLATSVLSGAFMLLSAFKNITIINPFYLFFSFLGSIGLTITSWKGISSWKE